MLVCFSQWTRNSNIWNDNRDQKLKPTKNHDISIRHCFRQCIRHYPPYKASPLEEGEWNQRLIRVKLTFKGLDWRPIRVKDWYRCFIYFPIEWLKVIIPVIGYRVHWFSLKLALPIECHECWRILTNSDEYESGLTIAGSLNIQKYT